ncbi:MAG: hypothetical protein FJ276_25335 [Planctomycetes bacterium]|nr:hypothetical protein [Planctomycetota bacterium]
MELVIRVDGSLRCLYDETLDLSPLGQVWIRRASHVEPTGQGQWEADLSPVAGPVLGPFPLRSEALAAEAAWLRTHWLAVDCLE